MEFLTQWHGAIARSRRLWLVFGTLTARYKIPKTHGTLAYPQRRSQGSSASLGTPRAPGPGNPGMTSPLSFEATSVDRSLQPTFAWRIRWHDPVASESILKQLLSDPDETDPKNHALALIGQAWHRRKNGDFETARDDAETAARLFATGAHSARTSCAQLIQAAAHLDLGDLKRAHANLARSLLKDRRKETDGGPGEFHALRARLHWFSGEPRQAKKQMTIALREGRDEQLAAAHHDHAWMCMLLDDRQGFQHHLDKAAVLAKEFEMTAIMPNVLALKAKAACLVNDLDAAWSDLNLAKTLADRCDNRRSTCLILMHRGECHAKADDPSAAIETTRAALELACRLKYRGLASSIAMQLGRFLTAISAYQDASAAFRTAIEWKAR